MKKNLILMAIIMIFSAGKVYAEGMVFDPTAFEVQPETNEISVPKEIPTHEHVTITNESISRSTQEASDYAQNSVSGQANNFNNW